LTIHGAPLLFDPKGKRISVAGHAGMVGSVLVRRSGASSARY
jgi:hypothetical protein